MEGNLVLLRYIDSGLCCFFPGKVLDEILYVVGILKAEENPPQSYVILQEVRELSNMAFEYFKEEIVPSLEKAIAPSGQNTGFRVNAFPDTLSEPNKGERRKENENKQILEMKNQIRNQNKIIQQQNTRIQQQSTRITEMENKWAEMNERLEELFPSF